MQYGGLALHAPIYAASHDGLRFRRADAVEIAGDRVFEAVCGSREIERVSLVQVVYERENKTGSEGVPTAHTVAAGETSPLIYGPNVHVKAINA